MAYQITQATKRIHAMTKRIRAIPGGTSAGKTIGIIQELIHLAQTDKHATLTSVTSESFPHLKRGAMRDFLDIMETHQYFKPNSWNKSDFTYTFETGSKIEFFSLDQPHKVRGPRRDRLFINEANNNLFETFEQLEVRTKDTIWLDWNPTTEFWYYEHIQNRDDCEELTLTYKDNEALDKAIVDTIERRKDREQWWRVYGLGLLGEVEGRVYKGWQLIDEIPHEARLEGYGLDFGYYPDPAAIVAVYYYNGGYLLDEIAYTTNLDNPTLAKMLLNLPRGLVVADSAEPKSIVELRNFGLNVLGAEKGPESVRYGVKTLQNLKISVTKRSLNLIKEYRNYVNAVDKQTGIFIMGKYDGEDHALDAARYKLCSLIPMKKRKEALAQIPKIFHAPRVNPA